VDLTSTLRTMNIMHDDDPLEQGHRDRRTVHQRHCQHQWYGHQNQQLSHSMQVEPSFLVSDDEEDMQVEASPRPIPDFSPIPVVPTTTTTRDKQRHGWPSLDPQRKEESTEASWPELRREQNLEILTSDVQTSNRTNRLRLPSHLKKDSPRGGFSLQPRMKSAESARFAVKASHHKHGEQSHPHFDNPSVPSETSSNLGDAALPQSHKTFQHNHPQDKASSTASKQVRVSFLPAETVETTMNRSTATINRSQSIAIHPNKHGSKGLDYYCSNEMSRFSNSMVEDSSYHERLYDSATWRMYNRIIDHRRNQRIRRFEQDAAAVGSKTTKQFPSSCNTKGTTATGPTTHQQSVGEHMHMQHNNMGMTMVPPSHLLLPSSNDVVEEEDGIFELEL